MEYASLQPNLSSHPAIFPGTGDGPPIVGAEHAIAAHATDQADASLDGWNIASTRPPDLPGHAIHVQQGVGCETCHGRIDQMPVVAKAQNLQMDWCLDCHRMPEKYIRPRDAVFTMGYTPPVAQATLGPQLVAEHNIHVDQLTDCSVCHR